MKKTLHFTLAAALALYGCAGSPPNPVLRYQPGDEKRSCTSLKAEIASNEAEIIRLVDKQSGKTGMNVAMGVAGVFLVVPWFFMDIKGKESGEIGALHHRNRNLRQFAASKECEVPPPKVKFERKQEKDGEENSGR